MSRTSRLSRRRRDRQRGVAVGSSKVTRLIAVLEVGRGALVDLGGREPLVVDDLRVVAVEADLEPGRGDIT